MGRKVRATGAATALAGLDVDRWILGLTADDRSLNIDQPASYIGVPRQTIYRWRMKKMTTRLQSGSAPAVSSR